MQFATPDRYQASAMADLMKANGWINICTMCVSNAIPNCELAPDIVCIVSQGLERQRLPGRPAIVQFCSGIQKSQLIGKGVL
jgi:hypothetical protein